MKAMSAIKKYMEEGPFGRPCGVPEIKALAPEDRQELGALACAELGVEFEPTPPKD